MRDLSQLKVCFVAGTLGQGGAERQLYYILRSLRDSGAKPRLVCLTSGEFWQGKIEQLGIPVTWIGRYRSRLARLTALCRTLRRNPPQLVQSQHFFTNLYAVAAARALGIREVASLRSDGISEVRANGKLLGKLSLRLPRVLVANSRTAVRNASAMGVPSGRLYFLPNVVDIGEFRRRSAVPQRPVTLLAAGRLVAEKRIDLFIRVVDNVRRFSPYSIKALVVGDGPLRSELARQASDLGLLPDVLEFRGSVEDMSEVYREADILVVTSEREGTPNVLLEAMASGLSVVATRTGGIVDLINPGVNGQLTESDDCDCITSMVLEVVASPGLRMRIGSSAREFVEANHSPRDLSARLAEIYDAALS